MDCDCELMMVSLQSTAQSKLKRLTIKTKRIVEQIHGMTDGCFQAFSFRTSAKNYFTIPQIPDPPK